jgi:hypothetical protein
MTRLYVFAEGQTEQTYGDIVLKRHLAAFGVYVQGPVLIAHSRRRGVVHRGGGRHYTAMKEDILRLLKQESGADVFFTTMIDLYALPSDFPGTVEAKKHRRSPYDRVAKLEECFAADVVDPLGRSSRFIPYIQLHEFEALLFCRPEMFSIYFDNCSEQIQSLIAIAKQETSPELINDGEQTAPSKRIIGVFPDYDGAKTTAGVQIAKEIGIETVRNCCPHFDQWLKRLESLSKQQV